jgi:hypothetical protein
VNCEHIPRNIPPVHVEHLAIQIHDLRRTIPGRSRPNNNKNWRSWPGRVLSTKNEFSFPKLGRWFKPDALHLLTLQVRDRTA